MKDRRRSRLLDLIRDMAAEFLQRESNRTRMITVTRVESSKAVDEMYIYISIFPTEGESAALKFAQKKAGEFRNYVSEKTKGKTLPRFVFMLDLGEKNRQRIEELTTNLETKGVKG